MRNQQRRGGSINVEKMEVRRAAQAPYGKNFTTNVGVKLDALTFESETDFTPDTFRPRLQWINFQHAINSSDITYNIYNSDSKKPVAVSDFLISDGNLKLWFPITMTQNIRVVVTG